MRRIVAALVLAVALAGCADGSSRSTSAERTPSSSRTPTVGPAAIAPPLPGVPRSFVALTAGHVALFDSASGRMLRILTAPPRRWSDELPQLGLAATGDRVVYFVRHSLGRTCADAIWRVPLRGGRATRVYAEPHFWMSGLTADRGSGLLAFSAEDCRRGAPGSGVYVLSPDGTIRGHVSDEVPPDSNGQPGASALTMSGDALAILIGSHNTVWIAMANPNDLSRATPRLIDLPFSGLPPRLNHGDTYCPDVGAPIWLRAGSLGSTVACYAGTTARTGHVVSTFLVTLPISGEHRGSVVAELAGSRLNVGLLSSDEREHLIGRSAKSPTALSTKRRSWRSAATRRASSPGATPEHSVVP